MRKREWKFVNDVLKPWDHLNTLLVERYAFQPDLSDITNLVRGLSVSIKHQVDLIAAEQPNSTIRKHQEAANKGSQAAQIVSDLADSLKHGKLKDKSRQCDLKVAAHFECDNEGGFRFLRNVAEIVHASLGQYDFLALSLDAMRYWARTRKLEVDVSTQKIKEAEFIFYPTAYLYFNEAYCIRAESISVQFSIRDNQGKLFPHNPPRVMLEIR